jgi:hypothetical protein
LQGVSQRQFDLDKSTSFSLFEKKKQPGAGLFLNLSLSTLKLAAFAKQVNISLSARRRIFSTIHLATHRP